MTIGEFSRRSGLSISALRFYDKREVLEPSTVNPNTGYRTYDASQLDDAVLVAELRRLHVPLSALKQFLAADVDERRRVLGEHVEELARRMTDAVEVARRLSEGGETKETNVELTIEAEELRRGVEQVLPAVGTDPERPLLMSMLIESKDGSLRLVSTDSHRLAVRDLPLKSTPDGFRALVAGASMARLLPLLSADGPVQIQVKDRRFEVSSAAGTDGAYIVDATYPDYEAILDAAPSASALQTERQKLADALASAAEESVVRLRFRAGRLVVSTSNSDTELSAVYDGTDFEFSINPRYAAFAVGSAVGPDVVLEGDDPLGPIVFRSADDGTFVCLVMPVRVD